MEYYAHLQKDKKLKKVLGTPLPALTSRKNVSLSLMRSIMGQQLSVRVGEVLYSRFLTLCAHQNPTPKKVITLKPEALRAIGLSGAKSTYILNVAEFCLEHKISDRKLHPMSNEDIIALLTQIKGVGRWTVEMLLMFTLGREDVFSLDDLGIQLAMSQLYGLDRADKKGFREAVLKIAGKWQPYRTYACMHLWQFKDNAPA
ncbi:MAG TPA: hypothetical protein VL053_13415 [Arachidicoccus sp.]|nr:hypothetical protein [Arachidicoccus sp.]